MARLRFGGLEGPDVLGSGVVGVGLRADPEGGAERVAGVGERNGFRDVWSSVRSDTFYL